MGSCNGKGSVKNPNYRVSDVPRSLNHTDTCTGGSDSSTRSHWAMNLTTSSANKLKAKYKVDSKKVGAGTFGKVYKATCVNDENIQVAIKSFSKKKMHDYEIEKVRNEILILQNIDHPNIVNYMETLEDEKHIFLVMDLCTGGDLLDKIDNSPNECLPEAEAKSIMRDLFLAINHCHSNGVTHRDLKLENIIFKTSEQKWPKIIDFGLGKLQKNKADSLETKWGSPNYVAPEVLEDWNYGQECDIWSLGVITYLLISGNFPFEGTNIVEIYENIHNKQVSFEEPQWKDISKAAKDFIKECLIKDRKKRITAEQALKSDWLQDSSSKSHWYVPDEVIETLKTHKHCSILKQETLKLAMKFLDDDWLRKLNWIFNTIDTNNSGSISKDDFKSVTLASGRKLKSSEINRIFRNVNYQKNGRISYSEFLSATVDSKTVNCDDYFFYLLFKHFDADDQDVITPDNIADVLLKSGRTISTKQLKSIFKDHNSLLTGEIKFDEFKLMLSHLQSSY